MAQGPHHSLVPRAQMMPRGIWAGRIHPGPQLAGSAGLTPQAPLRSWVGRGEGEEAQEGEEGPERGGVEGPGRRKRSVRGRQGGGRVSWAGTASPPCHLALSLTPATEGRKGSGC